MLLVRFTLFMLGVFIAYLVVSLMVGRPLFVLEKSPRRRGASGKGRSKNKTGPTRTDPEKLRSCPVCGDLLVSGEKLKSVVFQGGTRCGELVEKMCRIYGCPHCYPVNKERPRICPVCKKIVPTDGYLEARMFERANRIRKHVHVLGCTGCRNSHFS